MPIICKLNYSHVIILHKHFVFTISDLSAGEYAAIGCGIGGVCIFSAIAAKFGYSNCIAKK
jgi:hypothetical protein